MMENLRFLSIRFQPRDMIRAVTVLLHLVSLAVFPAGAQAREQAPPRVSSSIDWQASTLVVTLTQETDGSTGNAPARLHRAQQQIDREFASVLFNSLLPLRIDSTRTLEDAVRRQPDLAAEISALAERAHRGLPRPNLEMTSVTRQYTVPIFPDLAQLFIGHRIPFRMERVIEWIPTREFSGVIIYAADPLPHRGTGNTTLLTPALLPEIFDTDLRPILEQDMLDPDSIRNWGVVAYTEDFDEDQWRNRIGAQPLRIMARETFGVVPTDIVISREDADRLLSSLENRRLLQEGRILVIVAPGQAIVQ